MRLANKKWTVTSLRIIDSRRYRCIRANTIVIKTTGLLNHPFLLLSSTLLPLFLFHSIPDISEFVEMGKKLHGYCLLYGRKKKLKMERKNEHAGKTWARQQSFGFMRCSNHLNTIIEIGCWLWNAFNKKYNPQTDFITFSFSILVFILIDWVLSSFSIILSNGI